MDVDHVRSGSSVERSSVPVRSTSIALDLSASDRLDQRVQQPDQRSRRVTGPSFWTSSSFRLLPGSRDLLGQASRSHRLLCGTDDREVHIASTCIFGGACAGLDCDIVALTGRSRLFARRRAATRLPDSAPEPEPQTEKVRGTLPRCPLRRSFDEQPIEVVFVTSKVASSSDRSMCGSLLLDDDGDDGAAGPETDGDASGGGPTHRRRALSGR